MAGRRKAKKASPSIFCKGNPPKRPREIEALTEEDVRRFLQDGNVGFLSYMREYCDIRRIAASLLSKNMIGRGQSDNLIKASTPEEAASLCYSYLYNDPSVNKLEKLSTALREDERCDSHKRLAEKIDQFLQQGHHGIILPSTSSMCSQIPQQSPNTPPVEHQAGPSSSPGRSHSSLLPVTQADPSSSPGRPHSSLLPVTQAGLPSGEETLQLQHIQQLRHSSATHHMRHPAQSNLTLGNWPSVPSLQGTYYNPSPTPNSQVAGYFGLPLANPPYHSNPYFSHIAQPYQRQQLAPHPSAPEGELPSQQLAPQTLPLPQRRLTMQSQYVPQEMGNSVMYQHTTPSNHPQTHPPVIQYLQGPRPPATPPRSHVSPHSEQQMTRPPQLSVPTEKHQSQVDPFPHYLRPPVISALFLEEPHQTSPRSSQLPHQTSPRSSQLPHQTSPRSSPLPHQTSPRSSPLPHQTSL